ncbi:MAG: hypothetical protein WDA03_10300 [Trueperaceae bacterium]
MFNVPFGQFKVVYGPRLAANAPRVSRPDRLLRAGYADGERQPRQPRHWANR